MIRILLVDDQAILCQALQTWLEREPDFEVLGSAHDSQTAIEQVEVLQPDIVLFDIQMPGMDGITATQIVCERFPKTKVIVLSGYDDDVYLANALRAGAKGYLLKNTAAEDLANTIRSVHKGYSQMGPGLFDKMMATVSASPELDTGASSSQLLEVGPLEPELRQLLEHFDAQALPEMVHRLIDEESAGEFFTRLTQYLRRNPTNLAALYLAGVLSYRSQGHPLSAFHYLRFGFKEGIRQGFSCEELLLFYREGSFLKPEEAFSWLTQAQSPWNSEEGLSFLLQEADRIFGQDSMTYQILVALGRIQVMRQLSERSTALGSKLEVLQQGFTRLGKTLKL